MPLLPLSAKEGTKASCTPGDDPCLESTSTLHESDGLLPALSSISDRAILRGIGLEFERTLPYWRCFVDFRQNNGGRVPVLMERRSKILHRLPCQRFQGVDVVWARHRFCLRIATRPPKRPRTDSGATASKRTLRRYWIDREYVDAAYTFATLHFVHQHAHRQSSSSSRSFHVQSVIWEERPEVLQCVAGTMVSFAFLTYTCIRLVGKKKNVCASVVRQGDNYIRLDSSACAFPSLPEESIDCGAGHAVTNAVTHLDAERIGGSSSEDQLVSICPPPDVRALVLGMGGNSIALAMRRVLGPRVSLHIVEMEEGVIEVCRQADTLLEADPCIHLYPYAAEECLEKLPTNFDFVFMDLFEPMSGGMQLCPPLVEASFERLRPGGLLVINDHHLPCPERLLPLLQMSGSGNVHAVNLRGWNESVVVCVRPGDVTTDGRIAEISKSYANVAYEAYEAMWPGFLPHHGWLKSSRKEVYSGYVCRVWES